MASNTNKPPPPTKYLSDDVLNKWDDDDHKLDAVFSYALHNIMRAYVRP